MQIELITDQTSGLDHSYDLSRVLPHLDTWNDNLQGIVQTFSRMHIIIMNYSHREQTMQCR